MLILPIAVLWGVLYLAFGSPVGFVPLVYFVILLGAIAVFSRTANFAQLLRVNLLDILLAPTLSMIPLGGFLDSGGVGLWGILAPLGALVFSDVRAAVRWYAAYVVIFLGSGIAGEVLGGVPPAPPGWFTTTMLALNVVVGGTIVFTLLALFAAQRRDAINALRIEQAKSENLLLNILPRSIAEQLKAQTQPIADQFTSASILFADVVDFTPWAERRAGEVVGSSTSSSPASTPSLSSTAREDQDDRRLRQAPRARRPRARPRPGLGADGARHARRDARQRRRRPARSETSTWDQRRRRAGVIGRKRFLYDLWGDAINTASRMESHGTPGRIQITRATYELLATKSNVSRGEPSCQGQGGDGGCGTSSVDGHPARRG